jgi:hypothetical protein
MPLTKEIEEKSGDTSGDDGTGIETVWCQKNNPANMLIR